MIHNKKIIKMILRKNELNFCDFFKLVVYGK